jgi:hypothetical protein
MMFSKLIISPSYKEIFISSQSAQISRIFYRSGRVKCNFEADQPAGIKKRIATEL